MGPAGTAGAAFTSIQAAVDAALPGDWVLVAPGVYHEKGYSPTDGKTHPAEVYITTPNVHLRGMSRTGVIVDGTNLSAAQPAGTAPAGSPACPSAAAMQDPGVKDTHGNVHTREGILVWQASGVSIENLTACNSLDNEIWWNGGDGEGRQIPMALHGDYISATSTYYKNADSQSAQYGIFTSNSAGPGLIDHSYASNMTDSAYYIGACRNCNQVLTHGHAENSALGLSTTNAGGNLTIENSEWDLNRTGLVSNAQNNDDYPSPQYGQCVAPSTPPTGAGPNSCETWRGNYIHDNNNPNTPGSGLTSVSAVGAGVELVATQHISVIDNRIENNGAWGVITHDFPDPESGPSQCHGGIDIPAVVATPEVCVWFSRGNYVAHNRFAHNGGFANITNGDIANQATGLAWAPSDSLGGAPDPNCFTGNTGGSGAATEWPPGLQLACPSLSETPVLTAELLCATGATSLFTTGTPAEGLPVSCPPEASYPQHDGQCAAPAVLTPAGDTTNGVCFLPLSRTLDSQVSPSMPDPCAGVPANAFCPGSAEAAAHEGLPDTAEGNAVAPLVALASLLVVLAAGMAFRRREA